MIEGQEDVTWEDWTALAAACEEHGIEALFRSDHYIGLEHAERGSLDAWGTLCGLAAITTRLRLGTLVSPATFRHPAVLAKLAVTADHISGGRIEIGMGAGWHEGEHALYGFEFPPPRERMARLEAQLEEVHRQFEGRRAPAAAGAEAAPAADHGRRGRAAQRRARRALGRRVQHRLRAARRGAPAPRRDRRRLRGRRPRADPVLDDERLPARRRRGRAARARARAAPSGPARGRGRRGSPARPSRSSSACASTRPPASSA